MQTAEAENRVIDNYEDAKFAIMMYFYAASSGKELLEQNDKLRNDKASDLSEELNNRCINTIHKQYEKLRSRRFFRTVIRAIPKVAVIILAIDIVFLIFFSSASAFRAKVLNFVSESFGDVTDFSMSEGVNPIIGERTIPRLRWIPEDYSLKEDSCWKGDIYIAEYINSEGLRLTLSCYEGSSTSLSVESKDSEIAEILKLMGIRVSI